MEGIEEQRNHFIFCFVWFIKIREGNLCNNDLFYFNLLLYFCQN